MKNKTAVLILLCTFQMVSAQKLICKEGYVWFYSHTPFEDIEAHNHQTAAILDSSSGELVFSLLVKSFEFKKKLMEEHFNENYMESDIYPKAGFKGMINNFDQIDIETEGKHEVTVSGDLTIHGVTKTITVDGILEVKESTIQAKSDFIVKTSDYNISIPKLVKNKIAKEIEVHVDVEFEK